MSKVRFTPSVGTASGRRRGWIKHVTGVNPNGTNGYAIEGDFLTEGKETELPAGSILLSVDPKGSVRNSWQEAVVSRLEDDGSITPLSESIEWWKQFLTIRDTLVEALGAADEQSPLAQFSDEELLEEVQRRGLAV